MWARWRTKDIEWQILERLGEGAQGSVFKALRADRASGLRQTVALKILHSETAVELWRQEFESLARVRSPYCVQVYSFERVRGQPALVLEYVDGVSLTELGRTCLLSDDDVCELIAQVRAGLEDLRDHDLFHGDLSPHNVILDVNGRVRLLDFGLANGCDRLTPEFAAPERLEGSPADHVSDLFSLGRLELYLRAGRGRPSPLLSYRREARVADAVTPSGERQTRLARIVAEVRERRARSLRMATRTALRVVARARTPRALVAAFTFLAVIAAPASVRHGQPYATLLVRTRAWHLVKLDGREIGYAPAVLRVSAGEKHRLEWTSARGSGSRVIRLRPFERAVLRDRDFSH